MITLKLVDSVKSIERDILGAIAEELNAKIVRGQKKVERDVAEFIAEQINNSYEMIELRGGYLQGALGVTNPQAAVLDIMRAVRDSVQVKTRKYNDRLKGGGIFVYIQPSNFSNLLSLPTGNIPINDGVLHWLRWLLEFGDRIIVAGYDYDPESGLGRTGLGTMEKGGSFRIPPEFSGTKDDNFITRAIVTRATDEFIGKSIERMLQ